MEKTDSFYCTTFVEWVGDNTADVCGEGLPKIRTVPPAASPGSPAGWSPEHLFVAAVNASLLHAFLSIAASSGLTIKEYVSTAMGRSEKVEERLRISEILIKPGITLGSAEDENRAKRAMDLAAEQCTLAGFVKTRMILEPEWSLLEKS